LEEIAKTDHRRGLKLSPQNTRGAPQTPGWTGWGGMATEEGKKREGRGRV